MARRFLGVDETEIREALAAMQNVRDISDLHRLVNSLPVMRQPGFHAALRGIYLSSRADTEDPASQSFTALYDDLIYLLHRKSYAELCEEAEADPCLAPAAGVDRLPPRLYGAISVAIADHIAEIAAVTPMDPDRDRAELAHLLGELLGECPLLPEYEPEPGVSWTLLVVACAGCHAKRTVARAHAIDVAARPDLQRDLREGRFEDARCPACGEVRCAPVSVLLDESPASGDPLGALSCMVRLAADTVVFRPPPGTVDKPELRRLLEMRFSRWLDKSGWDSDSTSDDAERGRMLTLSVAYSSAEMVHQLDEFAMHDVPLAMKRLIDELATKLRTGQVGFSDVELILDSSAPVMAGWPVLPGNSETAYGHEWDHIAQALIAERVAAVQDAPVHVRALLAINTATAYIALYELAAADQSLHRAADVLAPADAHDPDIAAVRTAIAHHRADLLDRTGDAAGAARLRAEHDASEIIGRHQEFTQLAQLDVRLREGAEALGNHDLAAALGVLPDTVSTLRELTTAQQGDQADAPLQPMYLHRLCGALGNLGAALGEVASLLDTVRQAYGEPPQAQPGVPDAAASVALLTKLRPLLWRMFPAGFSPEQVREEAADLLEQGVALGERIGAWEFCAIQAHSMMLVLRDSGQASKARDWARRTAEFAAHVGDHTRLASAHAYMAIAALEAGDGEDALSNLAIAALEEVRQAVGLGYSAREEPFDVPLADGVIKAVAAGAPDRKAALVLESLKGARTAATLAVGLPVPPADDSAASLSARVGAAHRAREELRLELMHSPDDQELARQVAAADTTLAGLRQEASLRSPAFLRWIGANDVYLTDEHSLRRRLTTFGPDTRYLGFFRVAGDICGYLIGPDSNRMVKLTAPVLPADSSMRDAIELACALVEPFADELSELGSAGRLIISPDMTMLDVPFAAARIAGAPLCAGRALSFVHGTGMLEALAGRHRPNYRTAVVVGGPTRPDLPDLKGARREAITVRTYFGNGPTLTGPDATVSALITALGNADIVHIACHASTHGTAEPGSRLMLTPDMHAPDSGELSEDRVIAELSLPAGCLVSLAGCRTAHQEQSAGPLLAGLVPAFLAGGAGSVLAAQRPIADEHAKKFFAAFYRMLKETSNPAAALAKCQTSAAAGKLGMAMTLPEAWASYVLYGF